MRILVAGELNLDLILQGYRTFATVGQEVLADDATLTLGSSSAICAAGLARLGDEVTMAAKLGCDDMGDLCVKHLTALGVGCGLIARDAAVKTGVTVSISNPHDRAIVTYLGAMAALSRADIPGARLRAFQHLHVSSFFLQRALRPDLKRLFEEARGMGLTTSLDPGFDPEEQWGPDLFETLKAVDVFLPNEVELRALGGGGETAEALRALENGHTLTVAKLGANGCMALEAGVPIHVPAFPVAAVDTTGAGDSFNGGFLHAWLRKKPLATCLRFAAACGALSTLRLGGTGGQPDEAQALAFLERAA